MGKTKKRRKIVMANNVTGEMYEKIDGQLFEIKRQIRQKSGYPYDLEKLQAALQAIIEGEFLEKIRNFPIWKTIKLGTGLKTADDFRRAFKAGGYNISSWANNILTKPAFKASETKTKIDLIKTTVRELGFKDGATYKDICAKAKEFGLDLCPAEVGPQLRLQYLDQPMSECLVITMNPITASDGALSVFDVSRGEDCRWLSANYGYPDCTWGAGCRFVFVLRK
jgi:hypothetical protein